MDRRPRGLERRAELGHGLTLSSQQQVRRTLSEPQHEGLVCTLPFGQRPYAFGVLEIVAGREGLAQEWPALAQTLGLAWKRPWPANSRRARAGWPQR
ncbi:hypothetical protein [Deinococcus radiophilus]|uniref:hypothetical protein n=1 Tax=Deinococcus radiophilus TaxID=32062 RepID=UPI0036176F2D